MNNRFWQIGSEIEILIKRENKWYPGEITKINHDDEGELLIIRYNNGLKKGIRRFSRTLRSRKDINIDLEKCKIEDFKYLYELDKEIGSGNEATTWSIKYSNDNNNNNNNITKIYTLDS
eukprot:19423_1